MFLSNSRITIKIFFIIALLGGLFFGYILSEVDTKEELGILASYQPTTPTRLYDINGHLFAELYRHKQVLIRYRDIPPHVVQAFLAVEDNNFFNHFGIDFVSIARAAVVNILAGEIRQGGSTLTQQLAKTLLQNRKRTFTRKFIEALFTLQIEQAYSKEEILELYFNLIYLGHGTTGLASAADLYFQKDVSDLTVAEAAVLARLPKAPVKYSPFKNPRLSKEAHIQVLNLMADQGFIPKSQVKMIHDDFWLQYWPVVITQSPSRSTWGNRLDEAPYFTEHVRYKLEKALGPDLLYTGGLKIYTTLDIEKQKIAQEELSKALEKHDKEVQGVTVRYARGADRELVGIYRTLGSIFSVGVPEINKLDERAIFRTHLERELADPGGLLTLFTPADNEATAFQEFNRQTQAYSRNLHVEGAVITIEPSTGYIQTMVGGHEFTPKNQFNRAMLARRQVGSSFKPFVYGAALNEREVASGTGIMDAPLTTLTDTGVGWSPQDYDGDFMGMVPLSKALALSLNIVSVQLFLKTGADPIIDFASRLTKASPDRFPPHPSLALGVAELTPFEMATAYSIIANNGRNVIPFTVRYVVDQSGNVLLNDEGTIREELQEENRTGTRQVISEGVAYILQQMLRNVADYGTASNALHNPSIGNYHGEAAGKTGSTSSFSNAWFCGFDPKLTTVVWMGFDKSSVSLGRGQAASVLTVPIWGKMYHRFYEGKPYPRFGGADGVVPMPDEVQVRGACAFNGLSPKPGVCPVIRSLALKPKEINGKMKSVPYSRQCDGDRDHYRSLDFQDFLQESYEISDEELESKAQ